MLREKLLMLAAAGSFAVMATGCVSFTDQVPTPADDLTDEGNMAFVAQAKKTYEERCKFKRAVELKPAEAAEVFLSNQSTRNLPVSFKRDLLLLLESTLAEEIGKLRDFDLVGRADLVRNDAAAQVSIAGDQPRSYIMTYQIVKADFQDISSELLGTADTIAGFAGAGKNYNRRTAAARQNRLWGGRAQIEVSLYGPDGRSIFTFNEAHTSVSLPSQEMDPDLLKRAVVEAAKLAMSRYSAKFGPPMYVCQSIGGGLFVQISAGSAYGIAPGQRIEFFRNIVRKKPTLPGEPEEQEVHQQIVGSGVVGSFGAPVDTDTAWVYVSGNNDPEKRRVFVWTSARLAK